MKQKIQLGTYGWRQPHWAQTFYPEDLPMTEEDDWRLGYYSNEFNTVLVPADYWSAKAVHESEDWLDSVHEEFQFCVEIQQNMFEVVSLAELTAALKILSPQLSALIFMQDKAPISDDIQRSLIKLADALNVQVFAGSADLAGSLAGMKPVWRDTESAMLSNDASIVSNFALLDDELTDLRKSRATVERFVAQLSGDETDASVATFIVHHAQLSASNLNRLQSVLDIMGV